MISSKRLALGTWLFGGLRWGQVDQQTSYRTLCCAIERGIIYLDTSDAYGKGFSEELIGRLPATLKSKVGVFTKSGVVWNSDGTRSINISKNYVLNALHRSLERLAIDQIEVYFLHEDDSSITAVEIADTLYCVLQSGRVKYVGLSNFSQERIECIRSQIPIHAVQNEFNPLYLKEKQNEIKNMKNSGIKFFGYGILSKGLLTGKYTGTEKFEVGDNRNENNEFHGEKFNLNIQSINKLKRRLEFVNLPLATIMVKWAVESCDMDVGIIGCRTEAQLNEILSGFDAQCDPRIDHAYCVLNEIFLSQGM